MPAVKLRSSDGLVFTVDTKTIFCSKTIKTMFDDLGFNETEDNEEIPINNINASILSKVLAWATQHEDDDPPPEEEEDEHRQRRTDDICPWDLAFFKVDQRTLFEIILAANYLDISGLLDVTCKIVANMIKGKTAEEIRELFNIEDDLTEAEKEQIRKENQWCEER